MLRAGVTMFFASALLALMPSVAKSVSGSPTGYGILLGCFGAGAVLGALRHAAGAGTRGRLKPWPRVASPSLA